MGWTRIEDLRLLGLCLRLSESDQQPRHFLRIARIRQEHVVPEIPSTELTIQIGLSANMEE